MSDEDRRDDALAGDERIDEEKAAEVKALAAADHDEEGANGGPEAQQAPPGVLVMKSKDAQGNIGVRAEPVGGVEPTEVLTLLELAIDEFRARVGLRGR